MGKIGGNIDRVDLDVRQREVLPGVVGRATQLTRTCWAEGHRIDAPASVGRTNGNHFLRTPGDGNREWSALTLIITDNTQRIDVVVGGVHDKRSHDQRGTLSGLELHGEVGIHHAVGPRV